MLRSMKTEKRAKPISSHLDRTSLVNEVFIMRPKRGLFLAGSGPTRKIPKRQDRGSTIGFSNPTFRPVFSLNPAIPPVFMSESWSRLVYYTASKFVGRSVAWRHLKRLCSRLQWGTKVLRHFRKMAPFCIVDILIPFPCLPQPLPPKINVEFWTLKSFFYFRQHWFGGSGDLRPLKGMK